jgi:hypothetical protein
MSEQDRPNSDQPKGLHGPGRGLSEGNSGPGHRRQTLECEGLAEQVAGKAQERDGDSPYCSTKAG